MSQPAAPVPTVSPDEVRRAVDDVRLWYHTIELPHGVASPGWFDLRPILDRMPWPDVRGKRCLDVGTWDGHLAFEMERRGASEVVAIDIPDHSMWDIPIRGRKAVSGTLDAMVGEKASGFQTAHRLLGSAVDRRTISVYDLDPAELGTFDVVVCGSLLLHLRDPVRALEAIRSVTAGVLLNTDLMRVGTTLLHPRTPVTRLDGDPNLVQWWHSNAAAHRKMLETAGFDVVRSVRPYAIPYGDGHPPDRGLRDRVNATIRRALLGNDGVPHTAFLARPAAL
jgi:tRNA (mo5U34)-methyltransferase